MPSFDVLVKVDFQEVTNAVDQAKREISTRYDFKGSKASIELKEKESEIILMGEDKMKMSALQQITFQKLSKRQVNLKSITVGEKVQAGGGLMRQVLKIKQDLSPEELKRLAKTIKEKKMKVSPSIQGTQLRVTGKKRDDLQTCIEILKSEAEDLALNFDNFRD